MIKYSELNDDELLDLNKAGFINFDSLENLDAEVPNDVLNALGRDTVEASDAAPIPSQPATEEPTFWDNVVDAATAPYVKIGEDLGGLSDDAKESVNIMFPRGVKAAQEGANFGERVVAGVADASSMAGRTLGALTTALANGGISWEEFAKELEDTQASTGQPWWSALPENIIKDPVLPFTLGGGALIKGLAPVNNMVRPTALMRQVLGKWIPTASKIASGTAAGVAEVGLADLMENYAPGAGETTGLDYALGGVVGGAMPAIAPKFKAKADEIREKFGSVDVSIPKTSNVQVSELNPYMGQSEDAMVIRDAHVYTPYDEAFPRQEAFRLYEEPGRVNPKVLERDRVGQAVFPEYAEARGEFYQTNPEAPELIHDKSNNTWQRPEGLHQGDLDAPISSLLQTNPGTTRTSLLAEKANAKVAEFFNPKAQFINDKIVNNTNAFLDKLNASYEWGATPYNELFAPSVSKLSDMLGTGVAGLVENAPYRSPMDAVHLKRELTPRDEDEKGAY